MNNLVKKIVILGGGTAGWMSASMIKKILGNTVDIELVESESIGTVGVGEATIPPIKLFNSVLGIDEREFIKETNATIKLAIKFEHWKQKDHSYYHTFGAAGQSLAFCQFHHLLKRTGQLEDDSHLWKYDLNYLCATSGKFAPTNNKANVIDLPHAYHFDATKYAMFLRKYSENIGVVRIEGKVERVRKCEQLGNITSLILKGGQQIDGDLFIDCSGFKGLLIQEELNTGYEDWSHWLRCDRAIAIPSERNVKTLPYTRSIAHDAGWQWQIPLQHRNGNGLIYSSAYLDDDKATDLLMSNIDNKIVGDPNFIRFKTGRRLKQWNKNVIAIGLSSGFLEPLESTSIHLIQSAIIRLIHLFPHKGCDGDLIAEYNKQSKTEFEQIRDFIILHYVVNERTDSQFWNDMRSMNIPESLQHKITLFKENGRLFREQNDLFLESSWLQVMVGQGIIPKDYHPIANNFSIDKLEGILNNMKNIKNKPLSHLPLHDDFLAEIMKSKVG